SDPEFCGWAFASGAVAFGPEPFAVSAAGPDANPDSLTEVVWTPCFSASAAKRDLNGFVSLPWLGTGGADWTGDVDRPGEVWASVPKGSCPGSELSRSSSGGGTTTAPTSTAPLPALVASTAEESPAAKGPSSGRPEAGPSCQVGSSHRGSTYSIGAGSSKTPPPSKAPSLRRGPPSPGETPSGRPGASAGPGSWPADGPKKSSSDRSGTMISGGWSSAPTPSARSAVGLVSARSLRSGSVPSARSAPACSTGFGPICSAESWSACSTESGPVCSAESWSAGSASPRWPLSLGGADCSPSSSSEDQGPCVGPLGSQNFSWST